jgi:hypothetical protein
MYNIPSTIFGHRVRPRHHIAYFVTVHATRNWELKMRMRYCAELGLDPKLLHLYLYCQNSMDGLLLS